jgi:hypothetical protein
VNGKTAMDMLDAMVDRVLAYKPRAKKRKKVAKKKHKGAALDGQKNGRTRPSDS